MERADHGLAYLLAFDGRIHRLDGGYWIKFEIKRVPAEPRRPHGLAYSFTLHDPRGRRILGFDNAHGVPAQGGRMRRRSAANDHWHRTGDDAGRPYRFTDAETLLEDFHAAVVRALGERGMTLTVIADEEMG